MRYLLDAHNGLDSLETVSGPQDLFEKARHSAEEELARQRGLRPLVTLALASVQDNAGSKQQVVERHSFGKELLDLILEETRDGDTWGAYNNVLRDYATEMLSHGSHIAAWDALRRVVAVNEPLARHAHTFYLAAEVAYYAGPEHVLAELGYRAAADARWREAISDGEEVNQTLYTANLGQMADSRFTTLARANGLVGEPSYQ